MEIRTKFQPLVLIVKPEHPFLDEDREKDEFAGAIKQLYGCGSLSFGNLEYLKDWLDLESHKKTIRSNVIALVVEENLDCDYDLISEILLLRKERPEIKDIPTIILSYKRITSQPFFGGRNFNNGHIEIYDYLSSELVKLVHHLSAQWTATKDWLGLDYLERAPKVISLLEKVYRQNQEEGVNYSSPVDQNHMVVAEALRLKAYNGELVKERYDLMQNEKEFRLNLNNTSLQKDLKKIREMPSEQKSEFFSRMSRTMQSIGGCGPNILGFAIDPKTLEYLMVGYGRHNYVGALLKQHLEHIDLLKRDGYKDIFDNTSYDKFDFFIGTIFRKVDGIETPILKIGWLEDELKIKRKKEFERVLAFLKNQKKFIIVDWDYQLL